MDVQLQIQSALQQLSIDINKRLTHLETTLVVVNANVAELIADLHARQKVSNVRRVSHTDDTKPSKINNFDVNYGEIRDNNENIEKQVQSIENVESGISLTEFITRRFNLSGDDLGYLIKAVELGVSEISIGTNALRQFLNIEKGYLHSLKTIITVIMDRGITEGIVTKSEVSLVFRNGKDWADYGQDIMERIAQHIAQWPDKNMSDNKYKDLTIIFKLYIELAEKVKIYHKYSLQQEEAQDLFKKLVREDTRFKQVIQNVLKNDNFEISDLVMWLTKPYERIFFYPLLLKNLLNNPPPGIQLPTMSEYKSNPEHLSTITIEASIKWVQDMKIQADKEKTNSLILITPSTISIEESNIELVTNINQPVYVQSTSQPPSNIQPITSNIDETHFTNNTPTPSSSNDKPSLISEHTSTDSSVQSSTIEISVEMTNIINSTNDRVLQNEDNEDSLISKQPLNDHPIVNRTESPSDKQQISNTNEMSSLTDIPPTIDILIESISDNTTDIRDQTSTVDETVKRNKIKKDRTKKHRSTEYKEDNGTHGKKTENENINGKKTENITKSEAQNQVEGNNSEINKSGSKPRVGARLFTNRRKLDISEDELIAELAEIRNIPLPPILQDFNDDLSLVLPDDLPPPADSIQMAAENRNSRPSSGWLAGRLALGGTRRSISPNVSASLPNSGNGTPQGQSSPIRKGGKSKQAESAECGKKNKKDKKKETAVVKRKGTHNKGRASYMGEKRKSKYGATNIIHDAGSGPPPPADAPPPMDDVGSPPPDDEVGPPPPPDEVGPPPPPDEVAPPHGTDEDDN